jgi:class 3 adenylate cyclase/tetratricopeptide (TPR) repeat protein
MIKDTRKIAAILAADVVEYSRLMGADEAGTLAALRIRRTIFDATVSEFGGREFGSVGDSLMAEFPSAVNAVMCALALQQRIERENAPTPAARRMQLRIGVNLGDVIEENGVAFGDTVNVAARLQSLAKPGGVLISGPVYDQVHLKVSARFISAGARQVKNIAEPVRTFEVLPAAPPGFAGRMAGIFARIASRRVRLAAAGVLALVVAVALGLSWSELFGPDAGQRPGAQSEAQHEPAPDSIAVLRFVNLGSPMDDYRSIGLSLELANLLTRLRELHVSSQVSSLAPQRDVAQIRQRLAVRYFVEGSYRQTGDGITVEAQLVDTGTGYRLWSESISGGSEALVEAPTAIARRIVKSLDLQLSSESLQQLESAPTDNAQALDHYLRGNEWLRAPTDATTLASAEKAFLEAVKLDPNFAMPYGGLCRVHLIRYHTGRDIEEFGRAEEDCRRTLSLNQLQADPYKALGELYLASGRIDDAESQYQIAQRLSSRDAEALIGLADVAARRGRAVDAERDYRRAVALEPDYWRTYAALGRFLFGQARFSEAASAYGRITELDPTHHDAWTGLGAARYMEGDFDGALVAWKKALGLGPGALEYSNVGTAYFFLGRLAESARMYERAVDLEPKDHRYWGHLGDVRELLGQREPARAAYEKAADLARQNLSVDADDIETRVQLATYDARLGREDLAKRALAEMLGSTPEEPYFYGFYYDVAVAYTRLRMPDNALDALADAVKGGYPSRLVAADPQFDSLRALKRFSEIAR